MTRARGTASRYKARTDANQSEIVKALENAGATVVKLHKVGAGVPDLMVGYLGTTSLIEVKTIKGKLNPKQQAWHEWWDGQADIARTPEEAVGIIERVYQESLKGTRI